MADQIVSWGGIDSKGTSGMGVTGSLSLVGDLNFQPGTTGASRYISMSASPTTASGNSIVIQAGDATASGTGGSVSIQPGGGAGGPGGGTVIISNTSWWNGATVYGTLTATNAGPNTGTVMTLNAGGGVAMKWDWDNINLVNTVSSATNKILRFTGASQYQVRGSGTTSSTTALLVQNANASSSLQIKDNSEVVFATPDYTPTDGFNPFSYLSKTRVGIYVAVTGSNTGISYEGGQIYGNLGYSTNNPVFTPGQNRWTTNVNFICQKDATANNYYLGVNGGYFSAPSSGTDLYAVFAGSTSASGQGRILMYGETHNPKRGKLELYSGTDPVYGVISFSPGNTEAARFTPDGRLNIGAITGSAKVLISGSSNSALLEIDSPAVNNILYVSGSGNVGIGIAPDKLLTVGSPNYGAWSNGEPTIKFNKDLGVVGSLSIAGDSSILYLWRSGAPGNGSTISSNYDGSGGSLRLGVTSRTDINIMQNNGDTTIGNNITTLGARLGVKGSGTTLSTTSFLVQNANATNMLSLTDNGALTINTFQTSSTAFTINRTNSSMGSSFNAATMGTLVSINDTVGNSNGAKTTVYINSSAASINNAVEIYGGVGIGYAPYGTNFYVGYNTAIYNTTRIQAATAFPLTSRDSRGLINITAGGGISFWGDASGQGTGNSAFAGIRGLKANSTYVNPLGNLAFYVQTGSSSHVIDETTFREVARFNELGYFGIGTSTPSSSLHISGASAVLTLSPQDPLPSGVPTGSFAVSSSAPPKPYFYDGTTWNALY